VTTLAPTRKASFILIERTGSSGRRFSQSPWTGGGEPRPLDRAHADRSGRLQRVADAVHGPDPLGAELAAQGLDVAVDGAGRRGTGRRLGPGPDVGEQPVPGDGVAGAAGERVEQVELGAGEVDLGARDLDPARRDVDDEPAAEVEPRRRRPRRPGARRRAARPAPPGAAARAPGRRARAG
jgi:hypothetical protein